MEPVTHMLTGAVMARAGLNRKAASMTLAMAIAAEFPDIDMLWGLLGPVTGLEHHRGITHTFLGAPFEAALIASGVWAWQRWRKKTPAPAANWGWLFGGCLLALLSHILLDWTNNYGVRPFFPFDAHWYAGSFVFIVEPVMLLLLAMAFVIPALLGLIGSEVGVRKPQFRGRGWAIAALAGIAVLYAVRSTEHDKALEVAAENQPDGTTRIFASPQPLNPFTWSVVSDTPGFYQLSTVDSRRGLVEPLAPSDTRYKPETTLGLLAAKRTYVGRIYLDWSQYPVLSEAKINDDPNHPLTQITFGDARFMSVMLGQDMRTNSPLTARVLLDMAAPPADRVVQTTMGGRVEKGRE